MAISSGGRRAFIDCMYKRSHAGVPEDAMPNSDQPPSSRFTPILRSSFRLSLSLSRSTSNDSRIVVLLCLESSSATRLPRRTSRTRWCIYIYIEMAIVVGIDRTKNKAGRMGGERGNADIERVAHVRWYSGYARGQR